MKKIFLLIAFATAANFLSAKQPQKGYRGFIEWSNNVTSYKYDDQISMTGFYTGGSTSHGYQFNPNFYLGAGFSIEHSSKFAQTLLPVFVDARTDQKFGYFTPFGDLRIGYSLNSGGGLYFSPTLGYRFNWGRKAGINLGLGLSVIGYKVERYTIAVDQNGYLSYVSEGTRHQSKAYFTFRRGFDF